MPQSMTQPYDTRCLAVERQINCKRLGVQHGESHTAVGSCSWSVGTNRKDSAKPNVLETQQPAGTSIYAETNNCRERKISLITTLTFGRRGADFLFGRRRITFTPMTRQRGLTWTGSCLMCCLGLGWVVLLRSPTGDARRWGLRVFK